MKTKKKTKINFPRIVFLLIILFVTAGFLVRNTLKPKTVSSLIPTVCGIGDGSIVYFAPRTSVTAKQHNFHVVTRGVWRSAQPNKESLLRMKGYGLKTLVDLRGSGEREHWEKELSDRLGIQYYHFPMDAGKATPLKTIDAVLAVLSDPAKQPALVHCRVGKDRTGLVVAAYRISNTSGSFRDIYEEMLMYGYDEEKYPEILKTLQRWCAAHGRTEIAQEIGLREKILKNK
ncbi:MAG: Tyrosine phosphatase family protein [Candidatus Omnitrophica bacterium ADurb.Bin277]|nr:MAG: Tyrosine phosphatase family protein [Candidatus Omnitrophica bacterium ADurb.Bin277]